jgi:hypothetical protein
MFERLRTLLPKSRSKEEIERHRESMDLEKGDFLAMCIAAFITFVPVLLLLMGVTYGVVWLLFLR